MIPYKKKVGKNGTQNKRAFLEILTSYHGKEVTAELQIPKVRICFDL